MWTIRAVVLRDCILTFSSDVDKGKDPQWLTNMYLEDPECGEWLLLFIHELEHVVELVFFEASHTNLLI